MTTAYLDYNATAPLRDEARKAVVAALDVTGNASSVHQFGRTARAVVETAREQVAAFVGAQPSEVIFTSGATEANNWVMRKGWSCVARAEIEHDSVHAPLKAGAAEVVNVSVGSDGVVAAGDFADWALRTTHDAKTCAVTLQMANNETGVLQPVADVADFAHAHGIFMHTDAVQAVGRERVNFAGLNVDAMSLSAHKIGGPKGIGALILRESTALPAFISGGGQERSRRSGTENVAGIAGFGAAAAAADRDLGATVDIAALRDRLEQGLKACAPEIEIVGVETPRLANTTCFIAPGQRAETALIKLDLRGIAVSTGAACSSGKVSASRTLQAMGIERQRAECAIRVSIGHGTTKAEIDYFLSVWKALYRGDKIAA